MGLIQTWQRCSLYPWMRPFTERRVLKKWDGAGRPIPAIPLIKQTIIKDYQRRFGLRVGTGAVLARRSSFRPAHLARPARQPIAQELLHIAAHPVRGHVILIDDMREFDGTRGYPEAAALVAALRAESPRATVEVRDDILRMHERR